LRIFQLKDYRRLKFPTNDLALDVQIPMQKHKKYGKKGNITPPKFNNSIVANTNVSEMDETHKKFKK
jgi:hypothetical protein